LKVLETTDTFLLFLFFFILGDILPEEPAAVAVRRVYTGSSVAVPDSSDPNVFGPPGLVFCWRLEG
jgi:hypothetical protein